MPPFLLKQIKADVGLCILTIRNSIERVRGADPPIRFSLGATLAGLSMAEGALETLRRLLAAIEPAPEKEAPSPKIPPSGGVTMN